MPATPGQVASGATVPVDDGNRPLTCDDDARIPDDGRRWEVLDGNPFVNPVPGSDPQRRSRRLQRALADGFESRDAEEFNPPIDVMPGVDDICRPDLVVVTDPAQSPPRGIEGAPSLLVEIASSTTRDDDRITRSRRYVERGVAHYRIVDPESGSIDCRRNTGSRRESAGSCRRDQALTHPVLPGLTIALEAIRR